MIINIKIFLVLMLRVQALQHGAGECEGDVDRSAQDWQGKEEVQARQQRSLHFKDVSAWRFCHLGPQESFGCRKVISRRTCAFNQKETETFTVVHQCVFYHLEFTTFSAFVHGHFFICSRIIGLFVVLKCECGGCVGAS
jgi:hypothetical protein